MMYPIFKVWWRRRGEGYDTLRAALRGRRCRDCSRLRESYELRCPEHAAAYRAKRYLERPEAVYGGQPVYSHMHEEYFFDEDDLMGFIRDELRERWLSNDVAVDMQLVECDPDMMKCPDWQEMWELPEDWELSDVQGMGPVLDAMAKVDEAISDGQIILAWYPGKKRVVF